MYMLEYFSSQKKMITDALNNFLADKGKIFTAINKWGPDTCERFSDFAVNGKMIRGGLVMLAHDMYNGEMIREALKIACALELTHSSLLIHDDIIDNDTTRRGKDAIHFQYEKVGLLEKIHDAKGFSQGMGICSGDIGYFLCFELLSSLNIEPKKALSIVEFLSKDFSFVGLAQMQDVYFGHKDFVPSEQSVLDLYRYKTARYTFSVPLMTGAMITELGKEALSQLEKIGEALGIIFQIKDDELGIFSDTNEFGKPVGSDIQEAKKTIYYVTLMEKISGEEKRKLQEIFGSHTLTRSNIQYVKDAIISTGTKAYIESLSQKYADVALDSVHALSVSETYKNILIELVEYSCNRKK